MQPPAADRGMSRPVFALVLAMLAAGVAGRAVQVVAPSNLSDTAMFVYMGKLVANGGRVGVDLLDNKLPSVGLLMSVPYRLIGADWPGYAALGLAMTIVAALLLARAARRCLGGHAYWPVLVAATVWLNFPPGVFGVLQLETIQCFFVSLAACAVLELLTGRDWRDALTAGLCVGVAAYAKPTAAAVLPAAALALLLATNWPARRRIAAVAWLGLGAAIPVAVCAYLLAITRMTDALPETLRQLRDYSTSSTADAADLAKPVFVVALLLFPLLVLHRVFRAERLPAADLSPPGALVAAARRPICLFVAAWFAFELLGVVAQRRMYAYHFLVLAPPAALLVGLPLRRLRGRSMAMAFGPAAALSVAGACWFVVRADDDARSRAVLGYLSTHTRPGDAVWMDDYPRLLVETDLRPGSVVPLTFLFANGDTAPLTFSSRILADLRHRSPKYVVLYDDPARFIRFYQTNMAELVAYPARGENFATAWTAIDDYVRRHYTTEANVAGRDILVRRDALPAHVAGATSAE
ncbi:MAG TPA: glycosyltransferase 87 family protein [Tepidisphaeraceae bacterium]|jgi:hypothetical protein